VVVISWGADLGDDDQSDDLTALTKKTPHIPFTHVLLAHLKSARIS
jgi:hypothetical protein